MFQIRFFLCSALFLLFIPLKISAQLDAYFSQYMFNGLYINPAFAGYQPQLQASLFYKNYGNTTPRSPNTTFFSLSTPLRYDQLGAGFQIISDFDGVIYRNSTGIDLAYKLHLDNSTLAFGVNIGLQQINFDPNRLLIKDNTDPEIAKDRVNSVSPDFGTGLYYQNKKTYVGFSAMHLWNNSLFTKETFSTPLYRPIHLNFIAGYRFFEIQNWNATASFIFRYVNQKTYMADVTFHVKYRDFFWVGASVKNNLMVGLQTGFKISEYWKNAANNEIKIGYAFDYSTNNINYRSLTMHEILLIIGFDGSDSNKKIKMKKRKISPLFF